MSKRFFFSIGLYLFYVGMCNKTSDSENRMAYSEVLIKQSFDLTKDCKKI